MKKLIAFCGLDCESCDARIATLNNDDALRVKTAALWSELNGVSITPEMINCTGCRTEGVKTQFCELMCPIRQCAKQKGVRTCGDCADMSICQTLSPIRDNNPAAKERLEKQDVFSEHKDVELSNDKKREEAQSV